MPKSRMDKPKLRNFVASGREVNKTLEFSLEFGSTEPDSRGISEAASDDLDDVKWVWKLFYKCVYRHQQEHIFLHKPVGCFEFLRAYIKFYNHFFMNFYLHFLLKIFAGLGGSARLKQRKNK